MGVINKTDRLRRVTVLTGLVAMSAVLQAQASPMPTAGRTTQPIGHYEFCQNAPAECSPMAQANPHPLTPADWNRMVDINNRVNSAIRPLTDMEMWGKAELWSYPTDVGDCEDYVLLKRHMLVQAGFAPSNLLITVVRQPNGDGHAVLTVRTDRGDFVLDNLVSRINDWRDTPYTYLKRQNTAHAGRWEKIEDNRMNLTAAR